jgi:arsenate reductase (thioredoxin)
MLVEARWQKRLLTNTEKAKSLHPALATNLLKRLTPVVVEVMKERGSDISANKPKLITAKMAADADLVVTMGCSAEGICPGPFFVPVVDWALEDPKDKPIEKIREIRDDIERRVQELLAAV